MGKPSKASRNSDFIRQQRRKQTYEEQLISQKKIKKEKISDLQIQNQEFQKFIEKAGEEVINKLKKCYHENETMLKWITIYSQQIKNQEKEIYGLQLKHYLKDQNIPSSQPPSQPPLQPP